MLAPEGEVLRNLRRVSTRLIEEEREKKRETHRLFIQENREQPIEFHHRVMSQDRQGPLESPPSSLEEEVVRSEVVAADLESFRREGREEAEGVATKEGLEEPDKVGVATFDGETALWE